MKVLNIIFSCLLILLFLTIGVFYGQRTALESYNKALEAAAKGQFEQARQELEKVVTTPDTEIFIEECLNVIEDAIRQKAKPNVAIHLFKGMLRASLNERLSEYNKAINIDPTYSKAYWFRGDALLFGKNQFEEAILDFRKAIEIDPKYSAAYSYLGSAHIKKGKYDQAIRSLNMAIKLKSSCARSYNALGFAYGKKKQSDKAISNYNKAIELEPSYARAYSNRGGIYIDRGQYDDAILDFNKAIEIAPTYVTPFNERGYAYMEKGEYDRAIADFSKAIEIDPRFALAYENRGNIYKHKGQYTRYLGDLLRVACLNRNYSNILEAINTQSIQTKDLSRTEGKILKEEKVGGDLLLSTNFNNLDFDNIGKASFHNAGAMYTIPYATKENPIPFQSAIFTKPNKVYCGLPLFAGLPTVYPERLEGVNVSPSALLGGALGIVFFEDDGKIGAFLPVGIELPDEYWKRNGQILDISSIPQVMEIWNKFSGINLDIKKAREIGKKYEKFDSQVKAKSSFVRWPKEVPLHIISICVFVQP